MDIRSSWTFLAFDVARQLLGCHMERSFESVRLDFGMRMAVSHLQTDFHAKGFGISAFEFQIHFGGGYRGEAIPPVALLGQQWRPRDEDVAAIVCHRFNHRMTH